MILTLLKIGVLYLLGYMLGEWRGKDGTAMGALVLALYACIDLAAIRGDFLKGLSKPDLEKSTKKDDLLPGDVPVRLPDGSIRMSDGRVLYPDSILLAKDLAELLPLFAPPPAWPFVSAGAEVPRLLGSQVKNAREKPSGNQG